MKKLTIILIIILIIILTIIFAGETSAKKDLNDNYIIELTYNFTPPVIGKYNEYDTVKISGLKNFMNAGKPEIPFKSAFILIPFAAEIENITLIAGNKKFIGNNFYIKPGSALIPIDFNRTSETHKTKPDKAIYNSSGEFPGNLYSVNSVQNMRGYRFLILNLYPVRYAPKTGELAYFENMTLIVRTKRDSKNLISNLKFRGTAKDRKRIIEIIDNKNDIEILDSYSNANLNENKLQLELNPVSYDYVIITNNLLNSSNLSYNFQNLSEWKEQKGVKTRIVTIEQIVNDSDYFCSGVWGDGCGNGSQLNDTQAKIRNFIKDAYETWKIRYVLLGGDDEIIPHRGFSCHIEGLILPINYTDNDIPSDMYYGCLDGSFNYDNDSLYAEIGDGESGGEIDLFCEVYVGRAPASSAQEVSNFVMKTIAYESSNDSYLSKALMAGEYLQTLPNGSAHWGGDSMDEIKDGSSNWNIYNVPFPSCFNIETLYDRHHFWSKSEIINRINNNDHIINHLGHASDWIVMKMYRNDVDNLNNNKYFFGYSQGCIAGDYSVSDSILEHFVVKKPHGAFAFIGNSRYGLADELGTTNGPSQLYNRNFFDAVFGKKITNIGRANQYSKESLAGMINSNTGGMRWVYYELNLLGDPETSIHINCSAANPPAECKNLTVCKNKSCDYTRIDDAAGVVCKGHRIDVMDNETYNGTLGLFEGNVTLNCNGASLIGSGNGTGIHILSSDNSRVENCIVKNYTHGIYLSHSSNVTLYNNSMQDNAYNFHIEGLQILHYFHNINTSNKVNGKFIYYLVNEQDIKIHNAGFVGLVSCKNITVSDSLLANNGYGALIINTSASAVINNNLTSNKYGIFTDYSSYDIEIADNNITNMNDAGIYLKNSALINISNNKINETIDGIYLSWSSKNKIFNNSISSNDNNGIISVASSENELFKNTITKNYDGIWIYGSSNNNSIFNNTMDYNIMRGIGVENSCINNTITNNRIGNNNKTGVYFVTNDSTNNTLNFNVICGNPTDINDSDNNSGDNNICNTTSGWNDIGAAGCSLTCQQYLCDLNNDRVIIYDYNELIAAYKCFLGITKNCDKITYHNWNNMKKEYQCFVNNKL